MIKEGNGKAELKTVAGGKLTAWMKDDKIMLSDEKGGKATVTIPNVYQSNGIIHVIDHVVTQELIALRRPAFAGLPFI